MRPLRPHQDRAIAELRRAMAEGSRRPMLQMPTGAGKTLTAAWIIQSALTKGKRVVFTVPAISLIDQTVEALWAEGVRGVGVIQADHPLTNPGRPVQVASVQTLARRDRPKADLVIVDEAHRVFDTWIDWIEEEPTKPFIGLSATPWTKGLGRYFDALIAPTTPSALVEQGLLAPLRIFAPSHPDMSGARTVAGDFRRDDAAKAMAPLTGDVVSTWLAKAERRATLCFASNRAHAALLREQFAAAGVSAAYLDKDTALDERKRIKERFHNGGIEVVCNVGVLTIGVDWDVRCISFCRPTKSAMLFVQVAGRGMRTAPGKAECLVLDHSDTTLRLGFPTDIHHDTLDGGVRASAANGDEEARPALPRACPKCAYLRRPDQATCPACGYVPEKRTAGVDWREGELIELDARRAARANRESDWPDKVAFIRQLRAHAIATGKKEGWVAHKYRSKMGVWPNDPRVRYAKPAASVGPEVRSWLTGQAIRYAKARGA